MIIKFESVAAFQAGMPLIHFRIVGRLNALDNSSRGSDLQITTDTTVVTDRSCLFSIRNGLGFKNVGNRRRRTCLRTGATTDAGAVVETLIHTLDNPAIESATRHA